MPRKPAGPRLWLRKAEAHADGWIRPAAWIIKDGRHSHRTGCREDDREGAERALGRYLLGKHTRAAASGPRHISEIPIADAIARYLADVAPGLARPAEAALRAEALLDFFGDHMIGDVNGDLCRRYVASQRSQSSARRELEDLRAAINHFHREGLSHELVAVVLPPASPARERWLTRDEAARLIRAAWRYRERQNLRGTDRHTRRHIARFVLVALYTGTRPGAILRAGFSPAAGAGWFNLEAGVFYRRGDEMRETKKRQPAIRIPPRLNAHLTRWRRNGARRPVDWNGGSVASIRKAFAAAAAEAGLTGVTPHVLRHTAVTWAMQNGADRYHAAEFFGLTQEMIGRRYGHHHPDHLGDVAEAIARRPKAERAPQRAPKPANKTEIAVSLVAFEPRKTASIE